MPSPYSEDLRERVIARVESGTSRREAAEHFEICPSSAIKWFQCWRDTGSCAAKPMGGSVSPLDKHEEALRAIIAETPDITLDEMVVAMHERKIAGSRSALWRFLDRHGITFKKKLCTQPNASGLTWRWRAGVGFKPEDFSTRPGWCSSTRRRPTPR